MIHPDFYINLGKKIKKRRNELDLTQSELCGDFITRNMLSRLENGVARPSLETVFYLASRLGVSTSYLVSGDPREEAQYERFESIRELRRLFGSGQYKKCAALYRTLDLDDDELLLIYAQCSLQAARENMNTCRLASAERCISEAEEAAEKCSYGSEAISDTAALYRLLISSVRNGFPPSSAELMTIKSPGVERELLIFLFAISGDELHKSTLSAAARQMESVIYKSFLQAKISMLINQYERAIPLLEEIIHSSPGFFTLFFAMRDLEYCSQKTDDYKSAYECAKARIQLGDKFSR